MDYALYSQIRGELRNIVPKHVNIDIIRKRGKEKLEVFSRQPIVVERAIKKLLP